MTEKQKELPQVIICDWCNKRELTVMRGIFYQLQVYDAIHTLCGDCVSRLKLIEYPPRKYGTSQNASSDQ